MAARAAQSAHPQKKLHVQRNQVEAGAVPYVAAPLMMRKAVGGLTKRAMVTDIRPAREGWPLFQKAPNLPVQSSTGSAA
jgi:hypothetical protein